MKTSIVTLLGNSTLANNLSLHLQFQLGQPTFSAFCNVFIGEGHNLGLAFVTRQKSFY